MLPRNSHESATGLPGEPHRASTDPPVLALAGPLRRALGDDAVLTGAACARYAVRGRVPLVVACPTERGQVACTLECAAETDAHVVPWGNGTRQGYGYPVYAAEVVLSLERLTRVIQYEPVDGCITVEAGMTHAQLARVLARARQMVPLSAYAPERATVGGTIAIAAPSARDTYYGDARDQLLAGRVATGAGKELAIGASVPRARAGYDLSRLFAGSLGTLGVLTEVTLRTVPLPEAEATVLGVFDWLGDAARVAGEVAAAALPAVSVAAFHPHAFAPLAAMAPEPGERVVVAVWLAGPGPAMGHALRDVTDAMRRIGARETWPLQGSSHRELWLAAAHMTAPVDAEAGPAAPQRCGVSMRVPLAPNELREVLIEAQLLAGTEGCRLVWMADELSGMLWLRVWAEHDAGDNTRDWLLGTELAPASKVGAILAEMASRWPQRVVMQCCPALDAEVRRWEIAPAAESIMRALKRRFDPDGRLSPGRMFGGL